MISDMADPYSDEMHDLRKTYAMLLINIELAGYLKAARARRARAIKMGRKDEWERTERAGAMAFGEELMKTVSRTLGVGLSERQAFSEAFIKGIEEAFGVDVEENAAKAEDEGMEIGDIVS